MSFAFGQWGDTSVLILSSDVGLLFLQLPVKENQDGVHFLAALRDRQFPTRSKSLRFRLIRNWRYAFIPTIDYQA